MSASLIWPSAYGRSRALRARGARTFGTVQAIALLLGISLPAALEMPSKPFLEKNSFYLTSAGFRVRLANDPAGQKAMRALPAHRFVMHTVDGVVHYLYAKPNHCVC